MTSTDYQCVARVGKLQGLGPVSYHDKLHKEESSNTLRTQSYHHSVGVRNKCYHSDEYIEYMTSELKPLIV